MKRGFPPLWVSALILTLLVIWRMLGAPISAQGLSGAGTELWQARVLLPSRLARVLLLWQPAQIEYARPEALAEDEPDELRRELGGATTSQVETIAVFFADEGAIKLMPLESYVCGVVAAEMPARYHEEALKAQAVAARTRAVWQKQNGGCERHEGADVCTDSAHCQGYAGTKRCLESWGDEYDAYRARVVSAVTQTADELVTYGGEPITVMYHAMSGGATEAAQTVFSQSLPYLVSVSSAGEEQAAGFYTDTRLMFDEAAAKLNAAFPSLGVTAQSLRQTLAIGGYTPTGRVQSLLVGGSELKATEARAALGLRSTWFTLSADEDGITFHQRGYGHGVGMSQVGANSMAAGGADYREILAHYYVGTSVEKR